MQKIFYLCHQIYIFYVVFRCSTNLPLLFSTGGVTPSEGEFDLFLLRRLPSALKALGAVRAEGLTQYSLHQEGCVQVPSHFVV